MSSPALSLLIILYYCSFFPIPLGINVTKSSGKSTLAWKILKKSVYLSYNTKTLVAEVSNESLKLIQIKGSSQPVLYFYLIWGQ